MTKLISILVSAIIFSYSLSLAENGDGALDAMYRYDIVPARLQYQFKSELHQVRKANKDERDEGHFNVYIYGETGDATIWSYDENSKLEFIASYKGNDEFGKFNLKGYRIDKETGEQTPSDWWHKEYFTVRHGHWRYFNEAGEIIKEEYYVDGKLMK